MMMKSNASQCWDDCERGQSLAGGDGQAAAASEVVAVGISRALEQSEDAQAAQLPRQRGGRQRGQYSQQIATRQAMDVELGALDGAQESLIVAIEEVQALAGTVAIGLGVGNAIEQALARAVVVQAGEERQIALVAAEQDLPQVDQTVDGLLERCDFAGGLPAAMFHLAVVLEEPDIVGDGL